MDDGRQPQGHRATEDAQGTVLGYGWTLMVVISRWVTTLGMSPQPFGASPHDPKVSVRSLCPGVPVVNGRRRMTR